jgi:alanyl-tRNA synthetase
MSPNQLRQLYLDFFAKLQHVAIPSAPLVPENDPTTLFTSSGMQPLVPYLLGQPHPQGVRLVNSQKCFRANDIEEVGDNRHTTFFEMLGNWSLGDYFKQEQLGWFFQFLVEQVKLDPQRLFVTVYQGNEQLGVPRDTESVEIWQKLFAGVGIEASAVEQAEENGMEDPATGQLGRIFYYDDAKNWWSRSGQPANMPPGEPGGPDSEVFFDFGQELGQHQASAWADQPCHVNCDCGRFVEIGNSVFMQYIKQDDGSFKELPQKNVDFGGGLVRISAAQQNTPDVFETGFFQPIIQQISQVSSKSYSDADEQTKRSFRVVADHVRAAVMLAADGVLPANKEQGYFVRRLLRRAIRYGMMLGIEGHFVSDLVEVVAKMYQEPYPQVGVQLDQIKQAFAQEEQKFHQALRTGLREIEKIDQLDEAVAFKLYETHGFPFELTQEIAAEKGTTLVLEKFNQIRQQHADQSRTASAGKFKGGLADTSETTVKYHTATHLLHAALRNLLGEKIQQKGSNITADRLRFDFSFDRALTDQEKTQVEAQINDWISAELPMTMQMLPKQQALESGAIAFFDNYPNQVSVYTVGVNPDGQAGDLAGGWISKELCGGPHVSNLGQIGPIRLIKEQSAGAGIRRIYMELAD